MATPIYNVPLLATSSSERTVVNTSISLEEVLHSSVDAFLLNTPPTTPTNGYKAIVGAAPTGVWAAFALHIAVYLDGWYFYPPTTKYGIQNDKTTSTLFYKYNGTTWDTLTLTGGSAGGHIIQDETTDLPAQPRLAFEGGGVIATNAGGRTVVTIPGGGGASNYLDLTPQATDPAAPSVGLRLFIRDESGKLYGRSSSGTVYEISGSGSGGGGSTAYTSGDRRSIITTTLSSDLLSVLATRSTEQALVDGSTAIAGPSSLEFSVSSTPLTTSTFIRFQLAVPQQFSSATMVMDRSAPGSGLWKFQVSNDGIAWTDASGNFSLNAPVSPFNTPVALTPAAPFSFYQLVGVSGTFNTSPYFQEMNFT
jgi:Protein of unknown function (DUF2793)